MIPAVIKKLNNLEAQEIQIAENWHRKDLDPMDRAKSVHDLYQQILKAHSPKDALARISQRLNCKERTVGNLLSMVNLSAEGQKLLSAGQISQSHAYEICRRQAGEQKQILEYIADETYDGRGPTIRELKDFIRDECDHFLDAAPFDKNDATLLPGAGSCSACPKNSAVNPNLVDAEGKSVKRAICTDSECYKQKVQNNLVRIEKEVKKAGADVVRVSIGYETVKGVRSDGQWKQVKAGSCQYAAVGVLVDGDKAGEKIHVCTATNICKIHLATAVLRKQVTSLNLQDLREVALEMANLIDRRYRNPIFTAMGWKVTNSYWGAAIRPKEIAALKPADAAAFLALMTLASKILPGLEDYWPATHVPLEPFAKRHQVNLAKIRAQAAAPLQANWREIDAKKKAGKAAKAKPKKKVTRASAKKKRAKVAKAKPAKTSAKKKPERKTAKKKGGKRG